MRRGLALLCASALTLAPALHAADRKVSDQELAKLGFFSDFDELSLESLLEGTGVSVSVAARHPEPIDEASGIVTLITADEIRALGLRTLDEALRTVPGFDVLADNLGRRRIVVRGVASGIGGGSEGVLILLNGHRLNEDVYGGATVLNLGIPITGVRRIEILRGPASALYGEGAASAVLNLITEDPAETKDQDAAPRLHVTAGSGSFGQQDMALDLGGRIGDVKLVGFIQYSDTSGAQLEIPADAQTLRDRMSGRPPVSLAPGRTTDDVQSLESIYRVTYKDLQFLWRVKQEQSGGYIGSTDALGTQNSLNNRQLVLDALYTRKVGDGTLIANLGLTRNKSNELLEVIPPGFERTLSDGRLLRLQSSVLLQTALGSTRVGSEVRYERTVLAHDVSAGVSLERESTFGLEAKGNLNFRDFVPLSSMEPLSGTVPEIGRTVVGLWGQDVWNVAAGTTLTAGLRVDHVGDVGTRVSPRVVVVRKLPRDLVGRLILSRAYRAPSFRELAFDLPVLTGNGALSATTVTQLEASLTHGSADEMQVIGSAYLSWLRDPVRPLGIPTLETPAPLTNGDGVNIRGLELSARRFFGRHLGFISYSFQDPREVESDVRLAGVSRHLATLGGTFAVDDRMTVSPTWLLRTSRPRDSADARRDLAGYGLLNLTVRRTLLASRRLELRAILGNALDQGYRDPSPVWGVPGDYPRPGRSLFVDAKYRF